MGVAPHRRRRVSDFKNHRKSLLIGWAFRGEAKVYDQITTQLFSFTFANLYDETHISKKPIIYLNEIVILSVICRQFHIL